MFISISLVIVALILGALYYFGAVRDKSNQARHFVISQLRALIFLIRQHRAATHTYLIEDALIDSHHNQSITDIKDIHQQINDIFAALKQQLGANTKQEVRILQAKVDNILLHWEKTSVAKNQLEHGRVIRQIFFLVDETIIQWLLDCHKDTVAASYHNCWHKVLDALEVLTSFRISVQGLDATEHKRLPKRAALRQSITVRQQALTLSRKMNQLTLICPLTTADSDQGGIIQELQRLADEDSITVPTQALYQLSLDASLVIFNIYDQVLSDICKDIYLPLPPLESTLMSQK